MGKWKDVIKNYSSQFIVEFIAIFPDVYHSVSWQDDIIVNNFLPHQVTHIAFRHILCNIY